MRGVNGGVIFAKPQSECHAQIGGVNFGVNCLYIANVIVFVFFTPKFTPPISSIFISCFDKIHAKIHATN